MTTRPETVQDLHNILAPLQEKKGYYFNHDQDMTMSLLEQLLVTRKTHGYMACPCRFANGTYESDKDIICPCVYRAEDVAEFGVCYCGLYVSATWNERKEKFRAIPDRRPPENIIF